MQAYWTGDEMRRAPLRGDVHTDVAVIGAGIAGILIARRLHDRGIRTVVVTAGQVGDGQTSRTTAKITMQHGIIYTRLAARYGMAYAASYAAANAAALRHFREWTEQEEVACDYETVDGYLYTQKGIEPLKKEGALLRSLGYAADVTEDVPLPFSVHGALRMPGQAVFHPLRFLSRLSADLTIYGDSRVLRADRNCLFCEEGRVFADQIVFATHYPFVNFPGMYFTRMHKERSYVLALSGVTVPGIFQAAEAGGYTMRPLPEGGILFGGENHRVGSGGGGHYAALREAAGRLFPGAKVRAAFSAEDCMTPDGVPYIGHYGAGRRNWYVASGFCKWGMSHAMVAADILPCMIAGEAVPSYAPVFAPQRFHAENISGVLREGAYATGGLALTLFSQPDRTPDQLAVGEGALCVSHGHKVGAYRSPDGSLHTVSAACPHLGCELHFNADDRTWDCPCHGSRFGAEGEWISGPARKNITK